MPSSAPIARSGNDRGNVDVVLQNGESEIVVFATPLTATRSLTLPKSPDNNDYFIVNRRAAATGAFNVDVKTPAPTVTTLKSLTAASTWAQFVYTDNGGWQLVMAGTL
jgi:hypothetical protein